jgi:predicted GTPase
MTSESNTSAKSGVLSSDHLADVYGWLLQTAAEAGVYETQMLMAAAEVVAERISRESKASAKPIVESSNQRVWTHETLVDALFNLSAAFPLAKRGALISDTVCEMRRSWAEIERLNGKLTFMEQGYRLVQSQKEDSDREVERLIAELAEARFRPMGDNHHNALACPYCRSQRAADEPSTAGDKS